MARKNIIEAKWAKWQILLPQYCERTTSIQKKVCKNNYVANFNNNDIIT